MCGGTGLTGLGQSWENSARFSFIGGVNVSDLLGDLLQTCNSELLPRHPGTARTCRTPKSLFAKEAQKMRFFTTNGERLTQDETGRTALTLWCQEGQRLDKSFCGLSTSEQKTKYQVRF